MKKKDPKLTLAGAGPGDAELITLKAVNALREADVILYDALVNPELLKYAGKGVKKIYVGKRDHRHSYSQDQINSLIVELAFEYGHVLRLKGGDPFVFGRGQEELAYAAGFNIPTEYIPGISSSVAVPGMAGIPVTHRGSSESFWVITGTTKSGKISRDVFKAAQTDATLVILMGLNQLKGIVKIFRSAGKSHTPIAVIQDGSLPSQKEVTGTIATIEEMILNSGIGSPAVIVIGDVVTMKTSPVRSRLNKVLLQPSFYN